MKFPLCFIRTCILPITGVLLIIAIAELRQVCAETPQRESETERYILTKLQRGQLADLNAFPEDKRKLSAIFIAGLLSNRSRVVKIDDRISIQGAVITGELYLGAQEVASPVSLLGCTFEEGVRFIGTKFSKSLDLTKSTFKRGVDFSNATVSLDFIAASCRFISDNATFQGLVVAGHTKLDNSQFDSPITSFGGARVGRDFTVDSTTFNSSAIAFNNMSVGGSFSAQYCIFRGAWIGFMNARFADFLLNYSSFHRVGFIDFTRMEADLVSFEGITSITPSELRLQGIKFRLLSPENAEQLQFLLYRYNAGFYADVETSLRTHGYPDEADKIFVAKKRAERTEKCKDFLHQCNRGAWAASMFQDMLVGYGKRLQNLLYWSLGFLIIGTFVFRSEKGMRTKDWKDAPYYSGKYQAFWYSLDLFLPIIKLGEAETWTPRDNRRWALLYKKVHIILGSLFVPIGLAAWTGIIR
jgi:hypothetical protein